MNGYTTTCNDLIGLDKRNSQRKRERERDVDNKREQKKRLSV